MMAMIMILLAIFLMIFANQFVTVRITEPMKKLENSIRRIGVEQAPQIYVGGPPEIQHLGNTIRSMVEQLRRLTDDIVKEQEEKRKSELDALQSQINPHFLYNTLDSIMWMIESEQYEDAVVMVQSLGKLFRISLSRGENLITVGEELQHARSYLDIQKYRYKNKFRSFFDVEEGSDKCKTIKLIIQPLIENAIYYGMEYMDAEQRIGYWSPECSSAYTALFREEIWSGDRKRTGRGHDCTHPSSRSRANKYRGTRGNIVNRREINWRIWMVAIAAAVILGTVYHYGTAVHKKTSRLSIR